MGVAHQKLIWKLAIERRLKGRELTLGWVESLRSEIKYSKGVMIMKLNTFLINRVPAQQNYQVLQKIKSAREVFLKVWCRDFAPLILFRGETPYFSEVNTILLMTHKVFSQIGFC